MPDMLIIRFVVAFVIVLALIGLTAWLFRRFAGSGNNAWNRGIDSRVEIVETLTVDPKRRLVLVRCDDDEHLILVGGNTDIVVSGSGAPAQMPQRGSLAQMVPLGETSAQPRERARPQMETEPPLAPSARQLPPRAPQNPPRENSAHEGQPYPNDAYQAGRTLHRADHGVTAQPGMIETVNLSAQSPSTPRHPSSEFEPDFQDNIVEAITHSHPTHTSAHQSGQPPRARQAANGQGLQPQGLQAQPAMAARPVPSDRPTAPTRPRAALAHDPKMASALPTEETASMTEDLTAALSETMSAEIELGSNPPANQAPRQKPIAASSVTAQRDARKAAIAAPSQTAASSSGQNGQAKPSPAQASVQKDNADYDDMAKRLEAALKPLDSHLELKSAN